MPRTVLSLLKYKLVLCSSVLVKMSFNARIKKRIQKDRLRTMIALLVVHWLSLTDYLYFIIACSRSNRHKGNDQEPIQSKVYSAQDMKRDRNTDTKDGLKNKIYVASSENKESSSFPAGNRLAVLNKANTAL